MECKNVFAKTKFFSFPSNFNAISRITHQNMLMESQLMTAMKSLSLLHRMISGAPQRARRCWKDTDFSFNIDFGFFCYFERSCSSERNPGQTGCFVVQNERRVWTVQLLCEEFTVCDRWFVKFLVYKHNRLCRITFQIFSSCFSKLSSWSFKPQTKHNISEFR